MNPVSHSQIVKTMHFISVNVRHSLYFQHARVCHGDWEHCSPILEVSKDSGSTLIQPLVQFSSSVLNHVRLFVTPWTAAHQASLSITNSWSLLKLMSIELVIPSNHLILCHPLLLICHPLLLLPSIFLSSRVFSNESILLIKWPKYWSFSFSISPSNEYSGLIYFRIDWFDLAVQRTLKSLL